MPKIASEVAEANPPEEGKNYLIHDAEATTTDIQSYSAIRVTLHEVSKGKPFKVLKKDGKPIQKVTMLWVRDQVGQNSKMGSFLSAFKDFLAGTDDEDSFNDTDYWKGKHVHFQTWKDRNRKIKVLD